MRRIIPTFIRWNREVLVMRAATVTPSVFQSPSIDTTDARWAAEALASLARQLDPDSVIGIVLQRTQRELQSLAAHAECIRTADGTEVLGPIRIRM